MKRRNNFRQRIQRYMLVLGKISKYLNAIFYEEIEAHEKEVMILCECIWNNGIPKNIVLT